MARRSPSVLEVCVAKLGVHRGAITASYVARYAMTVGDLGHVPTSVEYAEHWAIDERTAWRHRARIREVFGEQWPSVVEAVSASIGSGRNVGQATRTTLPPAIAV